MARSLHRTAVLQRRAPGEMHLPPAKPYPGAMKQVLKQALGILLAFIIAATAVGLLFVGVVAVAMADAKPAVPKGCILLVDFSAPLTERGGSPSPMALLQGDLQMPLAAHEAASALRHAAEDERVKGVLLHGGVSGPLSALKPVRDALAEVRAAKKPVLAYYGSGSEKTLWWASAADELWMEPLGLYEFDGFAADVPYMGDALKKYGIEVQVTRVGKYKSAVEPFMLGRMSAENREQLTALLSDVQGVVLGDIAQSKGVAVDQLETVIREEGFLSAERAIALGLVTKAAPFGEMLARLRQITDVDPGDDVPQIGLAQYANAVWKKPKKGGGIAVIVAQGEIVDGGSDDGIGGDDLARALRGAREDKDVKAVVLRVDSPGGSATASDVIRSEILAIKAAGKPIVVSMGNLAASGGYWISANADKIVAQPETITGSIGVFGMMPNIEKLAEDHGLRAESVSTGPLAGWASIWHHKDAAQIAQVQSIVDHIYERFLDLVSEGRNLPRERVHEIAQGRVWSGRKAVELGLVDEIGGLDRAIEIARERATLGADAPVRYERREQNPIEQILEELMRENGDRLARAASPRPNPLDAALEVLEHVRKLAGTQGVLARLPFDIRID